MADYKVRILDRNEGEIKSVHITARNRRELLKQLADSYGSYLDARAQYIEILNTKQI